MAATIIRTHSHAEWLQIRKNGIGSSEAATILGCNPFETRYELWARKVGILPPVEENFAMRAGHYLEPAVAQFFSDETGKQIIKSSTGDWIARDNDRPFLQVSPDRTYWIPGMKRSNTNKGILECKTTQMLIDANDIPDHWFIQLQYQLGVTGLREGAVAWLISGREFGYRQFDFDPAVYKIICEQVEEFWFKNVMNGIEPEVTPREASLRFPTSTPGKYVDIEDDILDDCTRLADIRQQLAGLADIKKDIEDRVKMAFGDAERLEYHGETIATWKSSKGSTKFDEKRFAAEHPDLYREYQYQAAGSRRLIIK